MHRPFLLSWPLTLTFKTFEKKKNKRNNHFRNLLVKINILRYNKPWFTIKSENSAFVDVCYIVIWKANTCYITVCIRRKRIHLSYISFNFGYLILFTLVISY